MWKVIHMRAITGTAAEKPNKFIVTICHQLSQLLFGGLIAHFRFVFFLSIQTSFYHRFIIKNMYSLTNHKIDSHTIASRFHRINDNNYCSHFIHDYFFQFHVSGFAGESANLRFIVFVVRASWFSFIHFTHFNYLNGIPQFHIVNSSQLTHIGLINSISTNHNVHAV